MRRSLVESDGERLVMAGDVRHTVIATSRFLTWVLVNERQPLLV